MAKTTMVKMNYQSINECGAFTGEGFFPNANHQKNH